MWRVTQILLFLFFEKTTADRIVCVEDLCIAWGLPLLMKCISVNIVYRFEGKILNTCIVHVCVTDHGVFKNMT